MSFARGLSLLGTALVLQMGVVALPRQAKAVLGLVTGLIPVAVVGAAFLGASAVAGVTIHIKEARGGPLDGIAEAWNQIIITFPLAVVGLLLLEDSAGEHPVFQTIDESRAAELRVSEEDIQAYNSEVEELNAIRESISVSVMEEPTQERVFQRAFNEWRELLPSFQAGTVATLRALGAPAESPAGN